MISRSGRVVLALAGGVALFLMHAWAAAAVYWPALAALYAWSLARRPWLPCWWCGGSGTREGTWLFPWARGPCWRCGGKRGWVRAGVKVLTPARARRIAREYNRAGVGDPPRKIIP
jgi:hypothetical protein